MRVTSLELYNFTVLKIHLASQLLSRASPGPCHTVSHHRVFSYLPFAVTSGMRIRERNTLLYLQQLLGRQVVSMQPKLLT